MSLSNDRQNKYLFCLSLLSRQAASRRVSLPLITVIKNRHQCSKSISGSVLLG
ncbi:hypothetical protein PSI15_08700 [Xenorhabdus sp. PR6a]|uniref:hypothetical protein n=1 Tax=Xenorhabdus sp. PR6a TaxID=3025877 RepID=UPI002358A8AC|nr:hypothetical protein [Xenorhabdus sp. PR6a]MDC9581640.1 hypothetical protein [Xenorhabdus sp. PR6a]